MRILFAHGLAQDVDDADHRVASTQAQCDALQSAAAGAREEADFLLGRVAELEDRERRQVGPAWV